MSQRWEVGAVAIIVVAEQPGNAGRVVELIEWYGMGALGPVWIVFDGKTFNGDTRLGHPPTALKMGIAQWKMRLLDDDDEVETDAEGIIRIKEFA